DVTGLVEPAEKGCPFCGVTFGKPAVEKADYRHCRLLCARGEWPSRRGSEQRNECAPPHSITSSAVAINAGGTVRPSALAVLIVRTSSNFVGCNTGRSLCFSPFRIRPT